MVTYALVGSPAGGAITAFDTVSGAFIFQPAQDAVGSFSYTVTDQYNVSAPATVTIAKLRSISRNGPPGRDVTVRIPGVHRHRLGLGHLARAGEPERADGELRPAAVRSRIVQRAAGDHPRRHLGFARLPASSGRRW